MSSHPTTFQGDPFDPSQSDWNDHASLHRRAEGQQSDMLRGFNMIREGTFAELIRFVTRLPEDDRAGLVIQKSGDRAFSLGEILALSRRDDFPKD